MIAIACFTSGCLCRGKIIAYTAYIVRLRWFGDQFRFRICIPAGQLSGSGTASECVPVQADPESSGRPGSADSAAPRRKQPMSTRKSRKSLPFTKPACARSEPRRREERAAMKKEAQAEEAALLEKSRTEAAAPWPASRRGSQGGSGRQETPEGAGTGRSLCRYCEKVLGRSL